MVFRDDDISIPTALTLNGRIFVSPKDHLDALVSLYPYFILHYERYLLCFTTYVVMKLLELYCRPKCTYYNCKNTVKLLRENRFIIIIIIQGGRKIDVQNKWGPSCRDSPALFKIFSCNWIFMSFTFMHNIISIVTFMKFMKILI